MQRNALIAVGSNLGDRSQLVDQSVARIAALPSTNLLAVSSWHATDAIGGPADQPGFLNGAVLVATSLDAEAFLSHLQGIELQLGRERKTFWGPRSIDLDLLLVGDLITATPHLTLPHPRMAVRPFVVRPAAEIAADMVHPVSGKTLGELAAHLDHAPPLLALVGGMQADRERLSSEVAQACQIEILREPATFFNRQSQPSITHQWLPISHAPVALQPRSAIVLATVASDQPYQAWLEQKMLPPAVIVHSYDFAEQLREAVAAVDCMR